LVDHWFVVVDVVVAELDRMHERIAGRFTRSEPRARVREYVSGLVAGLERKNGWAVAERAGEVSPDGMQRLLRRAGWDVDGVRDDVRDYVIEHLGDPRGVLIGDETGFIKKGRRSAGVQRQYSGTAGRTENCQIGTFLAYASQHGHALIDRELYVPESWTTDRDRCRAADIPDEVEFAAKPRQMIAMLAIRSIDLVSTPGIERVAAAEAIAALPGRAWRRLSVGAGAHGPREYDWARIPIRTDWQPGRGHWLLARRSLSDASEVAYYVCYGPRRSTLVDLAWVAGSRWHVEECFQQAKNEAGLDHYQVRSWRGGMPTSPCPCWPWHGWRPQEPLP
jgi:SRSO17 transposase